MKKTVCSIAFVIMVVSSGLLFSQTSKNNAYLDTASKKRSDLTSVFDRSYLVESCDRRSYLTEEGTKIGTEYFLLARKLYTEKKYEESIDNYILAIKENLLSLPLYFYHLGVCLMDANPRFYELAKKSFHESIKYFFDSEYSFTRSCFSTYADDPSDHLYSYDDNGIKRETYFAFYNIACIESLQNNIDSATKYLHEALYHGYPYINHIRNDDDLRNLFRDPDRLRLLERGVVAGSYNVALLGEYFDLGIRPGGYFHYVHFKSGSVDESGVLEEYIQFDDDSYYYRDHNYRVTNYLIFSDAFRDTGFLYLSRFFGEKYYHGRAYEIINERKFRDTPIRENDEN